MRGDVWPGDVAQAIADLPLLLRNERERRGLGLRAAVRESGVQYHVYKRTEDGGLPTAQHAVALFGWLAESYNVSAGVTSAVSPRCPKCHGWCEYAGGFVICNPGDCGIDGRHDVTAHDAHTPRLSTD